MARRFTLHSRKRRPLHGCRPRPSLWGRRELDGRPNLPNNGDMKGSRLYVRASVNAVKKVVGPSAKKVRTVGQGVVEVIYTQQGSRYSIGSMLEEHFEVSHYLSALMPKSTGR